jgi:hypothetical protein
MKKLNLTLLAFISVGLFSISSCTKDEIQKDLKAEIISTDYYRISGSAIDNSGQFTFMQAPIYKKNLLDYFIEPKIAAINSSGKSSNMILINEKEVFFGGAFQTTNKSHLEYDGMIWIGLSADFAIKSKGECFFITNQDPRIFKIANNQIVPYAYFIAIMEGIAFDSGDNLYAIIPPSYESSGDTPKIINGAQIWKIDESEKSLYYTFPNTIEYPGTGSSRGNTLTETYPNEFPMSINFDLNDNLIVSMGRMNSLFSINKELELSIICNEYGIMDFDVNSNNEIIAIKSPIYDIFQEITEADKFEVLKISKENIEVIYLFNNSNFTYDSLENSHSRYGDFYNLGIATKSNREIFITNSLKDEIIKLN